MSDNNEWITVSEAALLSNYHEEHITRLCRQGKIKARKYSILWQVNRKSLIVYITKAKKAGDKRGRKV